MSIAMFNVAAELLRTCHATIAGRYPAAKFDVYFLSSLPLGQAPPVNPEAPDCRALLESPDTTALELTHNYCTENRKKIKVKAVASLAHSQSGQRHVGTSAHERPLHERKHPRPVH